MLYWGVFSMFITHYLNNITLISKKNTIRLESWPSG